MTIPAIKPMNLLVIINALFCGGRFQQQAAEVPSTKRLKKYEVKIKKEEWSEWISDIEGKAARVAASECGQQVSFM
jgi:hypothetical protein